MDIFPETPPKQGVERFWHLAATALCLAALWMSTHPYRGIFHDARLYTAQALHRLDPPRFAEDLYFAFGSQDAFTLFSAVYAPFVAAFGPGTAHALLTFMGAMVWIAALLWLTRSLFGPNRTALLAAVGVILLNPNYGTHGLLVYGEPFATPRLFAEALVMAALAAVISGRRWLGAFAFVGAMALHPLMTLPGIAVALLLAVRARRLWFTLTIIATGGLALALFDVEPFSRALLRFDNVWFDIVSERSPQGMLSGWNWLGPVQCVFPLSVLGIVARIGAPAERRLALAVLGVAGLGLVATLIGGDFMRNVLAVNLQTWRALWLVALFSNIWAVVIALRLPIGGKSRQFLLIGVIIAVIEHWMRFPPLLSGPVAAIALIAVLYEQRTDRPLSRPLRLAGILIIEIAILGLALAVWYWIPMQSAPGDAASFAIHLAVIGIGVVLLLDVSPWLRKRTGTTAVIACMLFLAAAMVADQRTPWTRFVETGPMPQDLTGLLADANTIYWEQGLDMLWFGLRRPSYYSCDQGAGMMFQRGTAVEYSRRAHVLHRLNTADFADKPGDRCKIKAVPDEPGPASRAQLVDACRSLPELDVLVLTRRVPDVHSIPWRSPVSMPFEAGVSEGQDTYHLYFCADLR